MKRIFLVTAFVIFTSIIAVSQNDNFYTTTGGEMIFSFATIEDNGSDNGNVMRWSPFFNVQTHGNYDVNKNLGFIFGLGIRNVGFIYNEPGSSTKKKFRNYNLAIPVGVKLGNLNKVFFYGGYEIEFPFNYKEKTYIDEQKTKFNVWFSKRVPSYYNTVFVGVQFPYGLSLKFKYYLSEFFNQGYTESDGTQPYKGLKANVFYFSITSSLFRNTTAVYKEDWD
ncbi:MAG: hypothetical protein HN336_07940 [Lentimicrobiaceae bacterium]|jgi:hypothetical protein|nr:hypothetical protein [Lentimicrobiaceae bacterium]MCP4909460.1 hypothetical protein [Bacteroidota bacterium]MBT3454120.1 hypothetical protein [Lentimicrobiaceae bacterium]MBT3819346.1 hypothetical protein [Lentimicrobiaceae bacterium]MBT4061019.1 hypothetical protein [Lentimicrobiaceae bacterium]